MRLKRLKIYGKICSNWFYICIFAIFTLSVYSGLADFDYYWQVDLGRQIVKNGDFNGIYNQSWSSLGISTYYDHEWLTNILFYCISLIGIKGISVIKLLISLFLATCTTFYIRSEKKELNITSTIELLIFLFIISTVFLKVKAYCISIGFLLLEVMFLKQYKRSKSNKYFIYMLILLLFWTNMHSGSMPLFFGVAGIYWLTNLRSEKKILLYGIGYLLSTLINPYGYKLVVFNLLHNSDKIMKQYVLDWRALDAKTATGVLCAFVIFMCIISLYKVNLKRHLFDVVMLFIVIFLSLQSVRHLIYLTPFIVSIVLDTKFTLKKFTNEQLGYISLFFIGLSVLVNISAFSSSSYKEDYAMDYVDDDLKQLLIDTNKDDCNNIFTADIDIWSLGLKSFSSGAFPCTKQRFEDSYLIMYCGSDSQIKQVIDYYGLTKFVFSKNNILIDYYNVNNTLYEYLSNNDEYECLYDSDFYCYFVKKGVVNASK